MITGTIVAADPVAEGVEPGALLAIRRADVGAAIWRRLLDPALAGWADACPETRLPSFRIEAAAADAACALAAALPCAPLLAADAAELARRFAQATGAARLRLRLDVVRDDACRRWHVDRVAVRLLCAYRGAGTEFGAPDAGAAPGAAPAAIRALARGEVGLFRGSLAPWRGPGLVHRSPPMRPGAPARLLLVVDAAGACG